jgi:hypothetical protein
MAKIGKTKKQAIVDKILHRKLTFEQYHPHNKTG